MNAINLTTSVVAEPDFGAFRFFVEAGRKFDVLDYCEAYDLDSENIDPDDIRAAQEAVNLLTPGQWLEVSHEVTRGRP